MMFIIIWGIILMIVAILDAVFDPDFYTILWALNGIVSISIGSFSLYKQAKTTDQQAEGKE